MCSFPLVAHGCRDRRSGMDDEHRPARARLSSSLETLPKNVVERAVPVRAQHDQLGVDLVGRGQDRLVVESATSLSSNARHACVRPRRRRTESRRLPGCLLDGVDDDRPERGRDHVDRVHDVEEDDSPSCSAASCTPACTAASAAGEPSVAMSSLFIATPFVGTCAAYLSPGEAERRRSRRPRGARGCRAAARAGRGRGEITQTGDVPRAVPRQAKLPRACRAAERARFDTGAVP